MKYGTTKYNNLMTKYAIEKKKKKQKQKLNDKRKFSKVLLRILWGKKANRVIRKLHSMTKYSSNKTKMSNMRKKKSKYFGGIH